MESTSNAAVMSLSGDKPRRKRTLDDKACEVCNDKSTGKHYGVYCCDGCSGFFKRTVRRSIPWLCRNNNQCVVDKASRTDCRACRFQKCLMVNMNPEGVQNLSGSRVSYQRTNRENDSSEMNYSDFGQAGTTVEAVDSRDNSSTSSVNPSFPGTVPGSSSSPPISMALADANNPDLQHRLDSPVLIKVETQRCGTYTEVDRNSEIVGNNSENVGHNSEIGGSSSGIVGSSSAIVGNTSTIVGYNSEIVDGNSIVGKSLEVVRSTSESRNRNVSSLQVAREASSTKTGMVTFSQPVRPVMPTQQPQVVPTQMLVVPNTSFTHRYPYQSTHYPLTSPTPRYAVTNHDNRTPGSTEFSLRPKVDSVHNMAVQLLSKSVQFAKNVPSFKSLPFRDQIILLEESWKDLFILDAAFWSFPLDVSCIVSPGDVNTTLVSNLRVLQELVTRIQALELDETECGHLKTVVLFKPDIKGLKDSQQIEKHQDEALVKLSDYVRTTRVESPARFGRLLLTLSAFERISQEMIEKLFFRAQNDGVEYILHDLFKKT